MPHPFLTADGAVTTGEAVFLKQWLEINLVYLDDPVINLLYFRLSRMLQDNVLDADESQELLSLLRSFSGLPIAKPKDADLGFVAPNDLPFDAPAPDLIWDGKMFVFTGIMAYGPRKDCQALIEARGARVGRWLVEVLVKKCIIWSLAASATSNGVTALTAPRS